MWGNAANSSTSAMQACCDRSSNRTRHYHGNQRSGSEPKGDQSGGMRSPPDLHDRRRLQPRSSATLSLLYHVFSLSLRDVELILAERGVVDSHRPTRRREQQMQRFKSSWQAQDFLLPRLHLRPLPSPPTSTDSLCLSRNLVRRPQSLARGDLRSQRSMIATARRPSLHAVRTPVNVTMPGRVFGMG